MTSERGTLPRYTGRALCLLFACSSFASCYSHGPTRWIANAAHCDGIGTPWIDPACAFLNYVVALHHPR